MKFLKDLKSQAGQLKEILANEEVEGLAAMGKVKVLMDGNQKVLEVNIDPELVSQRESLQMALAEAFNDAVEKVHNLMAEKLKEYGVPGGMDLPGM
ncbi:YbaB/EbfC family nucleoid-associated protein [Candidatus Saccharibacteria bacterium]|nr:YbaB/EbfC family nucleoid-associated protein [Candidatus Saccharibacteria bacterium]